MSSIELVSEHGCFGGVQRFYKHASRETRGTMKFSVYLPPQARTAKVPVLYYLAGLTCTEAVWENAIDAPARSGRPGVRGISGEGL